CVIMMISSW
nr:immunoglobulin heavy chain junction region [Macaca mulatta]